MHHRLEVYITNGCYGCNQACALATKVSDLFPNLEVEIINLDHPGTERPSVVFAVPTYLLDGELLWLGNPHREEAMQEISSILEKDP